jgi:hypothetical protein
MKILKLIVSLWLVISSLTVMAEDNQGCTAADDEAQKAFDLTKDAYNSGNQSMAAWHKASFSKIYENNKNCPFIKILADQINSRAITSPVVSSTNHSDYSGLLEGCQPPCSAIIIKPGTGTGTGMGTRGE